MGNLIKNEFIKSYKKKGIIIMIGVIIAYALLSNIIYKTLPESYETHNHEDEYYSNISVSDYDLNSESELEDYIGDKSISDVYKLREKYDKKSWQYAYISENYFYEYYDIFNRYELGLIDKETYDQTMIEYNELLNEIEKDDWKLLVQKEIDYLELEIDNLKNNTSELLKDSDFSSDEWIESLEIYLEYYNLRLTKNIPFGYDYQNTNLEDYLTNKLELTLYDDVDKLEQLEKEEYYEVRENYLKAEYALNNNIERNIYNTSKFVLENFIDEYFLMILIFIFMISGSITSQEFNKGTIKLLLLRPYSRIKILLSKYIVALSSIFISFIVILFIQIILGIVILDIESLSQPALMYNFYNDSLQVYSIYEYVVLNFLAYLPQFILLTTFVFAVSTITTNTALSMILGFVMYLGSTIFDSLVFTTNVWWQKIIYIFHWDLSPYIFNYYPRFSGGTCFNSILVCIIYLLIILVPTFIIFKKKDIKNI